MPLSEFEIIRQYFARATAPRGDVRLGIGDDCALLSVPAGQDLAVSMDTLVEGRHFVPGCDPRALGHKALAVNLSDLAAIGARPAWVTLSLTLPRADTDWLQGFAAGLAELANGFGVQLVGGDTTRGPLSITLQVHGFVDAGLGLRRDAALAGDHLYVSGQIGDAALALQLAREIPPVSADPLLQQRLERPTPRVGLGLALGGYAHAAIDVSDGLVADLGHLCAASDVGAELVLADLPTSEWVAAECARGNWTPVLAGGDDYELLFSAPPQAAEAVRRIGRELDLPLTRIGFVSNHTGLVLRYPDGRLSTEAPPGFDHFRDS